MNNYITKQVTKSDLNRFLNKKLNVCLIGKHGCGKTQRVKEVFDEQLKDWAYFSGSTMDPWIHLLGIPKEEEGKLKFIKPEGINESLEGIFIDEYNRSSKEVRNALMELMQFKTMNGTKFPNLKVVWAAVNPPSEEDSEEEVDYDVEKIDPAQLDRFQVIINIPYGPDLKYFASKYDHKGATIVRWWGKQPKKFQMECSPRRLECALQNLDSDIGLNFILPKTGNIKELVFDLTTDPVKKLLVEIKEQPTLEKISDFVQLGKTDKIKELFEEESLWVFASALPKDMFSQFYKGNERFMKFCNVMSLSESDKAIQNNVEEICKAHKNENFAKDYDRIKVFSKASGKNWEKITVNTNTNTNNIPSNLTKYLYSKNKHHTNIGSVSYNKSSLHLTSYRDAFFKNLLNDFTQKTFIIDREFLDSLNYIGSYQLGSIDIHSKTTKNRNRGFLLQCIFHVLSSYPDFRVDLLSPPTQRIHSKLMGDKPLNKNNNTTVSYNVDSYINEYNNTLTLLNGLFS